jgi:amino acid transporter
MAVRAQLVLADALPGIDDAPARSLGMWDAVGIIVGIVVGTAIFKSPTLVFQNVPDPWTGLGVWVLGGFLSFCGALCYAELATAYQRSGGDYEYLTQAYGRLAGFLFGWAQLTVVLSGSIGAMAYAFADYGTTLANLPKDWIPALAAGAVLTLTIVNLLGVVVSKHFQNVLSVVKVAGLAGMVVLAMLWGGAPIVQGAETTTGRLMGPGLGLAMVFALYAYGGWNDAAFVAAEVRDPRRNIPRALFAGLAIITLIYLAVNAAILKVLGFDAARQSFTPAADLLHRVLGPWGARAISALVMISALGAIHGMILTGSRIYVTLGADHSIFRWLGSWNRRSVVPVASLLAQAAIAFMLILLVGTESGQKGIDWVLNRIGAPGLPWETYFGGFETLVAGTAPVFWLFFILTAIAVPILRWRDAGRDRPFRIPLYPIPALIFIATCAYMLYSSLNYAGWLSILGMIPLIVALPLYLLSQTRGSRHGQPGGGSPKPSSE